MYEWLCFTQPDWRSADGAAAPESIAQQSVRRLQPWLYLGVFLDGRAASLSRNDTQSPVRYAPTRVRRSGCAMSAGLSGAMKAGTPPINSIASTRAPIQSGIASDLRIAVGGSARIRFQIFFPRAVAT